MSIQERAILADLNISLWTARKYDRKVSEEINNTHQAADDAGRYNKALLSSSVLSAITSVVAKAREYHYKNTLPWKDNGSRILPSTSYFEYTAAMRKYRDSFEAAVHDLVRNYDKHLDNARARLKSMYDPNEYPPALALYDKFSFDTFFSPVPSSADFRVDLSDTEVARIQQDLEAKLQEVQNRAMKDVWGRIEVLVKHMFEKLDQKQPRLYSSMLDNIYELVGLLPSLNINDDPALTQVRKDLEQHLLKYDIEGLRTDKHYRREARDAAKQILDNMTSYQTGGIDGDQHPCTAGVSQGQSRTGT